MSYTEYFSAHNTKFLPYHNLVARNSYIPRLWELRSVRMIPTKRHKSKYPAVQHQLADSAALWLFFFPSFIWSSVYT